MEEKINTFELGWNLNKTHRPIITILKHDGFIYLIRFTIKRYVLGILIVMTHSIIYRYFTVDNIKYSYQKTKLFEYDSLGERVIEIPYVRSLYDKISPNKVLEVGNVTRKWFHIQDRTIIDKYEIAHKVINADIEKFQTDEKFDMIISISTIEHIGFDEIEKDDRKPLNSIINMLSFLNKGGQLIITVPLGYNPNIDEIITKKTIDYDKLIFMKRYSKLNLWRQCSYDEAISLKYGSKYEFANAVAFITLSHKHLT
ncbi:MAG: methyltransferase domain-containing protein [Thermoplasmataceae archaeon]